MIELTDIHKTFKVGNREVEALKGVNIRVDKGEVYGVIGFSGAGKSTLLRMINLLEKPTRGRVTVNGQNLLELNEKQLRNARKRIGIIFQHFNLLSSLNIFDNVAEILRINRVPKPEIQRKVDELLKLVGLEDKAKAYPSQLSGGQKQRVGIARALAMDPEILLCDEATSALDPQTTESILELLLDINRKLGLTIVLITHEMHVIQKICDKVAVMENGQVIEQGTVLDIFSVPKHNTTKNFIRTIFNDQMPEEMVKKIKFEKSYTARLRITFRGDAAMDSVIGNLSSKYAVDTNILYGSITSIKGTALGILIVQISGEKDMVNEAISFIKDSVYNIEIQSQKEGKREVLQV